MSEEIQIGRALISYDMKSPLHGGYRACTRFVGLEDAGHPAGSRAPTRLCPPVTGPTVNMSLPLPERAHAPVPVRADAREAR